MRGCGAFLAALWLTACNDPAAVPRVPCADLTQGCETTMGTATIAVRTDVTPAPLQPFTVSVRAPQARQVWVGFEMEGMAMGPNRYRLTQEADGTWRARVTLPVCVSGRRDWLMIVEIDGTRRGVPFTTQ